MPNRITLTRAKGTKRPAGVISVARPSRYGNPYRVGTYVTNGTTSVEITPALAVALFTEHADQLLDTEQIIADLGGADLGCWCKPGEPCHGDVLLDIANPLPTPHIDITVLLPAGLSLDSTEAPEGFPA